jgi:galactose mutarotase-like enzyme
MNINYHIENTGEEVLPFNIGDHPGFNIDGDIEDYHLEFSDDEDSEIIYLNKEGKEVSKKIENKKLPLTKDMFEKTHAKRIMGIKSNRVTLYKKDEPVLRYTIKSHNLLLWSADINHFLCIEPWYGEPNLLNDAENNMKSGKVLTLNPGESFEYNRRISFYNKDFMDRLNSYRDTVKTR